MKRTAEGHLEIWIGKKRRKPLILKGARQTGKSTLVRMFASKKGLLLNEINLEQHLYLDDAFKTLDINNIIRELEAVVGSNLQHPGSLLFLDKIQATPHALQALRYFFEDKPGIINLSPFHYIWWKNFHVLSTVYFRRPDRPEIYWSIFNNLICK